MLKAYKGLIKKMGYEMLYDGTKPEEDSGVFFVLFQDNPDNPNEPRYTFFEIFTGAPLSLDGYEQTVINENNVSDFMKMIEARIKGCTINKSAILACLLSNHYLVDSIYNIDGSRNLNLKVSHLKLVSHWVNFQGGLTPRARGEAPRQ